MTRDTHGLLLGPRFERALVFANALHRTQTRKNSSVPYMSHLLAVCSLVLEHGGDEDQAIAALLHDGPEDQGGAETLATIEREFGVEAAKLVADCTEPLEFSRAQWRERKEGYLAHLGQLSDRSALIAGCDKVHNARNLVEALERDGFAAFERFNGKAEGTKWWHMQLAERLAPRLPRVLHDEFVRLAQRVNGFGVNGFGVDGFGVDTERRSP